MTGQRPSRLNMLRACLLTLLLGQCASFVPNKPALAMGTIRQHGGWREPHWSTTSSDDSSLQGKRHLRPLSMSWTAIRTTARTATGISLTAVYASTLAATGAWIRQTMRVLLSILPPGLRYFVQPFLIMYYVPLFILRTWTRKDANKTKKDQHDVLVEGWKLAVEKVDDKLSYWPVHLSESNALETDIAEVDMKEAIAESVEIAYEDEEEDKRKKL